MFITTIKARDGLFSSMLKSPGAQFKNEDTREHFKWAKLGVPTMQLELGADGMRPVGLMN